MSVNGRRRIEDDVLSLVNSQTVASFPPWSVQDCFAGDWDSWTWGRTKNLVLQQGSTGPPQLRSRKAFTYPILSTRIALPKLSTYDEVNRFWLGLEENPNPTIGGIASFRLDNDDTGIFYTGGGSQSTLELQLHSDWLNFGSLTQFRVFLHRDQARLAINGIVRAVIVFDQSFEDTIISEGNYPYAVGLFGGRPSYSMRSLIEAGTGAEGTTQDYTFEMTGNDYRVGQGDPQPAFTYPLYTEDTNTQWAGFTTSAIVTSHPIPVWGYEGKSLLFQSDSAGDIDVEIYAGGAWRVFESRTLSAGSLEVVNLNVVAPLARVVYTPTDSDTIQVAECNLR